MLEDSDRLMHSGMYSLKEPGAKPVKLAILHEGGFNQHLLPFATIYLSLFLLILHVVNGQPYPSKSLWRLLKGEVKNSLKDAMRLGKLIGLSLPTYVLEILPRLLYVNPENPEVFNFQFCPYFTPSALQVRWTRINRINTLPHTFINLCHRILYPNEGWKVKQPMGI